MVDCDGSYTSLLEAGPESNQAKQICNPLRYHSAIQPQSRSANSYQNIRLSKPAGCLNWSRPVIRCAVITGYRRYEHQGGKMDRQWPDSCAAHGLRLIQYEPSKGTAAKRLLISTSVASGLISANSSGRNQTAKVSAAKIFKGTALKSSTIRARAYRARPSNRHGTDFSRHLKVCRALPAR